MKTERDLVLFIEKFEHVQSYFGKYFLRKAISHYFGRKENTPYYHIANFMVLSFHRYEFFTELEELFLFSVPMILYKNIYLTLE